MLPCFNLCFVVLRYVFHLTCVYIKEVDTDCSVNIFAICLTMELI